MFRTNTIKRIVSMMLAVMMLLTASVPSFAMGFDDLQTVVDMTGGSSVVSSSGESSALPDYIEQEPGGTDTGEGTDEGGALTEPPSPDAEAEEPAGGQQPAEQDEAAPNVGDEPELLLESGKYAPDVLDSGDPGTLSGLTVGSSGNDLLIPDGHVLYIGTGAAGISTFSLRRSGTEETAIYIESDWSMTHRYPFGTGTSTMPAYIFTTEDGRVVYCIEPAKFNSIYGHVVTGQLQYDKLSKQKQLDIARAIAANPAGASDHRMYLACQTVIWEIAAGQNHRSGSIYNDVIVPNGLTSEYEEILAGMEDLKGEIPSFMSDDKDDAPYYEMTDIGGSWTIELENTNENIELDAGDFSSVAAFRYDVDGDTLTVTTSAEPQADSFVQWSRGEGGSGLIFWVNDQNIQDKATWEAGALPGVGYMKFYKDAVPPPDIIPQSKVGYLEITKYDGTTNQPLGGAVFRVECDGFIDEAFAVPYGGAVIVIPIPEDQDSVEVTVTEVVPPDLYELDPTPKTVTVTAGELANLSRVSFENFPLKCSLTVYKYDKGDYSNALSGAKFRIRYADPSVSAEVWERTTGADGTITIDPLPAAGTLVIEELEAPAGFEIGPVSTHYVTVEKGQDEQVDVSNEKRAQLVVYKKDAVSGQLLAGATFQATCISNGVTKTAVSDAAGKATFYDLIPNEQWRIEEISPPPYFLPSTKVETVTIPDDSYETIELTWENEPYSGLTIRKISATDSRGLKGAVFGLYQGTEADPQKFLGEFETDENGRIVIQKLESNLHYTVVERLAPINHLLDEDNSRTIFVRPDALENNVNLIFRNKEKPKILIEKVNEHDVPIPNCTFKISRRDSAEYQMVTTGPDGTVLVEGLLEDWYQVVEVKAADGTLIDETIRDVQLVAGTTTTLRFTNYVRPSLTIQKIDEATGRGLDEAVIRVWREGVDEHQDYTTQGGGYIRLTDLEPGFILCQEIKAPAGFVLDGQIHRIELKPGENHSLVIKNRSVPQLTLRKVDELTLAGIEGVTFRFSKDGEHRDVTTGRDGVIREYLEPGWWSYQEISCPDSYLLDDEVRYVEMVAGEDKELTATNRHKPSLRLYKTDSATSQPLEGVHFTFRYKDGTPVGAGEYVTGANGEIYLEDIEPGYIQIKELPYEGYIALRPEQEVLVEWGKVAEVYFENEPENPILIKKISTDGQPIEGCVVQVLTIDGGFVAELKTGRNGYAVCTGISPGWYLVKEVYVEGHVLDDTPKQVELKIGQPAVVELVNRPLNGIEIYKKTDDDQPLEGVEFTVKKENDLIGVYQTSAKGLIQIPDLEPGFYTVFESRGVEGYIPDAKPQTVELEWGDHARLEFVNTKFSDFQAVKRDSVTKEPIANVSLRITKMDGEYVGDYKTNSAGAIACELEPGWYTCFETAAVAGYVLDSTPQNFEVKEGKPVMLEFWNTPLSGLQILKEDQDGKPLAGVQFTVRELDGREIGVFTSDVSGVCYIPELEEGHYVVTETKWPDTHKGDPLPRNVFVETGKLNKVTYVNHEYPVLVVRKVSAETMEPLGNVRFRLLDKYQREIGVYTTHPETGQIILTGMDEGDFYLQEVEAAPGYRLDSTVRKISLRWGKTTTVEVNNTPLASLRLKKVSSEDQKPIPNVEFILYDMKNNVAASGLVTNQDGVIELPGTLEAGRYKLRELKTDPAFVLDTQLREIELKPGSTTEIVIENEPKRGQIQITKVAGAFNSVTKDKEGAPLGGAVFEIYDNRMTLVDTIETDPSNGLATSKPLPLGVYGIVEKASPEFYFTNGEMFFGEIKVHGDLIKFKVKNTPVELITTVEKRGVEETKAGESFYNDLSNIQNASNVPLSGFYIRDTLPTEAVRLDTVWTGEWSDRVRMDFQIRTNRKSGWRTVEKNLLSTVNNEIDCSRSALGLAAGEYVTEFRIVCREEVQPGFHDLTGPKIKVRVLDSVKNGQKFVNKVDAGGEYGGEWVYDTDGWTTITFNKPRGRLPKTGL